MGNSFFDFQERLTAARRPAAAPAPSPGKSNGAPPAAISVSQLTHQIDRVLKAGMPPAVNVRGEVSNYKHHGSSGHAYFTLKDADACIDCVMFKTERAGLKFLPADGMELIASGRIGVYGQRGRYQLYVSQLLPLGVGALELAFKQLHAKLKAEGLFEADRKRPLPKFPSRVALVTSKETAALQDMLKVLRRFAWLKLSIYHVPVQGDGSAEKIAAAIEHLNRESARSGSGFELLVLARGGGSLEDLWEFNEECVARAIFASAIPVVTGIGHEVDVSIADLVADYHAHTPTEAAQVITAAWRQARETVGMADVRLHRTMRQTVQDARHRLNAVERHEVFRRPLDRINALRQLLDDRQRELQVRMIERTRTLERRVGDLRARLECHGPSKIVRDLKDRLNRLAEKVVERHPRHRLALAGQRVGALDSRLTHALRCELDRHRQRIEIKSVHLNAVGPEQVLRRGYSITTVKRTGQVVRDAGGLKPGDRIITRLADGSVESTVDDRNQPGLFE